MERVILLFFLYLNYWFLKFKGSFMIYNNFVGIIYLVYLSKNMRIS